MSIAPLFMRTLVIIPTYNERENILPMIEVLYAIMPSVDILIVDDASPDGTGQLVDAMQEQYPGRLFVLHRERKMGLGSAYLDGFRYGRARGYDLLCEMDADGSHDPGALPILCKAAVEGADVVIGSRRVPGGMIIGWGVGRHVMSFCAMWISRLMLGLTTKDVPSGFRVYRAAVVDVLLQEKWFSDGYAFQEEAIAVCERKGFRIVEMPVVFRERQRGTSKLSWREVMQFCKMIWFLRKDTTARKARE